MRLQGQKTWEEVRCQVCRSTGCGFGFSSETIRCVSRPVSCCFGRRCVFGFFGDETVCRNSVNAFDLVCMSFCAVETQRHNIFWSGRVLESWCPGRSEQETDRMLSGFSKRDTSQHDSSRCSLNRTLPDRKVSPLTQCFLDSPKETLPGFFLHSPDLF